MSSKEANRVVTMQNWLMLSKEMMELHAFVLFAASDQSFL